MDLILSTAEDGGKSKVIPRMGEEGHITPRGYVGTEIMIIYLYMSRSFLQLKPKGKYGGFVELLSDRRKSRIFRRGKAASLHNRH